MSSIAGLPEGIVQNTSWVMTPQEAHLTAYQLVARACKRRLQHDRRRPVKTDPGAPSRQVARDRTLSIRSGLGATLDIRL